MLVEGAIVVMHTAYADDKKDCIRDNMMYLSDSINPSISHFINSLIPIHKAGLPHIDLSANSQIFICGPFWVITQTL